MRGKWIVAALLSPLFGSSLTAHAQVIAPPLPIVEAAKPENLPLVTWDEFQRQIGGPSVVTLQFKNTPAPAAIEALGQQAPVEVPVYNLSGWEDREARNRQIKTVTGDYVAQPFWDVARDLLQQLNAQWDNGQSKVIFQPYGAEKPSLVTRSGPAIFTLSNASFQSVLPQGTSTDAPSAALTFSGRIYLDPKSQLLVHTAILHVEQATGATGASLLLPETDRELNTQYFPLNFAFNLAPPPQRGGRLQQLSGSLQCVVPFRQEDWQVPHAMNAKDASRTLRFGDHEIRLELEQISREGEAYQAVIVLSQSSSLHWPAKQLSTGKSMWIIGTEGLEIKLFDAAGHDLKATNYGTQFSGGRESAHISTITLRTEASLGAPDTVVMNLKYDWRELVVPFEFKNLPLP